MKIYYNPELKQLARKMLSYNKNLREYSGKLHRSTPHAEKLFWWTLSGRLHISLWCLLLCILMTVSPAYFCSSSEVTSPSEGELYQQCRELFSKGSFAEADECISRFRSLYPESRHDGEMLFMRAFLQPAIDISIETYQALIEKYPDSEWAARAHFQLGQCYYLQGEYDRALDYYGKIIVSYSDSEVYWPARYWKCKSLIARGDYEDAIKSLRSLEESAAEKMGRDMVLMALGSCYLGMKDYKNAEATYRSLIESIPDSQRLSSAYLLLANSLQNLGRLGEAKEFYQKVVNDYGLSIEAQQAHIYLNSLSSIQPQAVKEKPVTTSITPKVQESPTTSVSEASAAFTIQIGAFSVERNADDLANKLRKKGYSVKITPPEPGKSRLYKVTVGTFKTRDEALEAAQQLGKNEKLDTKVVP